MSTRCSASTDAETCNRPFLLLTPLGGPDDPFADRIAPSRRGPTFHGVARRPLALGTGLAFYLGKPLIQTQAAQLPPIALGGWSDSPVMQAALQVNPLLPLGLLLAFAL